MDRDLPFDRVAEDLWLGPCPRTPELITGLRESCGVTALLSVQTDRDLEGMGLSWSLLWRFLMRQGISAVRRPIIDFDDRSLISGLSDAVEALQELRAGGQVTYVHCSVGVNRSPTVVIAWLATYGGLGLDAAWEQVTTRRRCAPNRKILESWMASR